VVPDGRITILSDMTGGGRRPVEPSSPEGIAILTRGSGVIYRFADDEQLRDLPYPDVLKALRHAMLLAAHKARHGAMLDEPEVVPDLRQLIAAIEETALDFRRRRE
jgi:hypothetical protein